MCCGLEKAGGGLTVWSCIWRFGLDSRLVTGYTDYDIMWFYLDCSVE